MSSESDRSATDFLNHRSDTSSNSATKSISAGNVTPAVGRKKQRKQATPSKQEQNILREIQRLQESTEHIIPQSVFGRLISDLLSHAGENSYEHRITGEALEALQECGEMYMTEFFQDCYLSTLHRNAATLSIRDLHFVQLLRHNLHN